MLLPRTEHVYARPSWDCRACGEPWPCAPAKVELAEQYRNVAMLNLYLLSALREMIDDFACGPIKAHVPSGVYDRGLGWAAVLQVPVTGGSSC